MSLKKVKISINPLVDFTTSTDNKKERIIRDQKSPKVLRVGWYQTPRACIRKSLRSNGDMEPILEGINRLKAKIPTKPQQIQNKRVSLEAMRKYLNLKLPKIFKNHSVEIIKESQIKSTYLNEVEITISPDLIFKVCLDGKDFLGAIKLHISKGNIFDIKKSRKVSSLVYKHMIELSEKYNLPVLPELCLSIDVFGEHVVSTPTNFQYYLNEIEVTCEEVKLLWKVVA